MTTPYTSQSAPSSYNQSPPPDDGSTTAANRIRFSTFKTKLTDPIKTFIEAVNSALVTAFSKVINTDDLTLVTNFDTSADQFVGYDDSASAYRVFPGSLLYEAFATGLLHIVDTKSAGTAGGTFTSGAWQTRDLNGERTNEITGASLASNQITLAAGTYYIEASAPAHNVAQHVIKLRNVSDSTDTLVGTAEQIAVDANSAQTRSFLSGRFTIAASKTFELQHRCTSTQTTSGFGNPVNVGVEEIYADVRIWKVA